METFGAIYELILGLILNLQCNIPGIISSRGHRQAGGGERRQRRADDDERVAVGRKGE